MLFCAGPKGHIAKDSLECMCLLGPGQDLENHRGKSQGGRGMLVSLRPTLSEVQCG